MEPQQNSGVVGTSADFRLSVSSCPAAPQVPAASLEAPSILRFPLVGGDAGTLPRGEGATKISFAHHTNLYQPFQIRVFTSNLTRECLTESSFPSDLASCGAGFDPQRLAQTLHRVDFWREILELSLYKRSLRDLVIKGEEGIKNLDEIDNFYARVSAEGSELLLNLALSELFHLPSQVEEKKISPLVAAQCRAIMRAAVGALQREYNYNTATQKFVGPDGLEVDVEALVPFRSRYNAERKTFGGDSLSRSERKLLAAYRVLGREIGRLKQEIALLRAVTDVEDQTPTRAVDAALDKVAGVTQHLSDIEPNRLALRYYLHRRVRSGMRDLLVGLTTVGKISGAGALESANWIAHSDLTLLERLKLSYLHLRHGQYGSLVTKIAVGQSLFMVAVGLTQYLGQFFPLMLGALRGAPVLGQVFQFAEQPLTKMGATLILLGALDLIPNAIISWQSRKLGRYLRKDSGGVKLR